MASSFDVQQLEDSISCVSFKDMGSFRYHMGSALIAMVGMLHALHSLWVSLFPFVVLWWNAMLCATCTKYFSWNWSQLWLPIVARRRLYGNITQETGPFAEASNVEESHILSGSCAADAWHAEKRQMRIPSFYQCGSCLAALPCQDPHSGVSIQAICHQRGVCKEDRQRGSTGQDHCVGVFIQASPHNKELCKCGSYVDVAAPYTDEWVPHLLNQMEELASCESTSVDSPAQATRSYISKLASLSFLNGRGLQQCGFLKPSHCAACSSLLQHQVPLLDVGNPVEYLWLQLTLRRNGDMFHIKVPMLVNAILGEWLQICIGRSISCVPALTCGEEYPYLAWHFIQFLPSGIKNAHYMTFQLVLPTTDIASTISIAVALKGAMEDVESRIREQLSSLILSLCESRSNVAYFGQALHNNNENSDSDDEYDSVYCNDAQYNYVRDDGLKDAEENSGSVNCEDLGGTLFQSDDVRVKGVQSIYNREGDWKCADVICSRPHDGDEFFCCYNHHHEADDSSDSCEDLGYAHGNDEVDGIHDHSFHCDVGDDGLHCVEDVGGIYVRLHCDADEGFYDGDSDFDDNVEDNGDGFIDFEFVDDNGPCVNSLEIKQLHVECTWWDEDAVLVDEEAGLVDEEEGKEDSMQEQAWQVV